MTIVEAAAGGAAIVDPGILLLVMLTLDIELADVVIVVIGATLEVPVVGAPVKKEGREVVTVGPGLEEINQRIKEPHRFNIPAGADNRVCSGSYGLGNCCVDVDHCRSIVDVDCDPPFDDNDVVRYNFDDIYAVRGSIRRRGEGNVALRCSRECDTFPCLLERNAIAVDTLYHQDFLDDRSVVGRLTIGTCATWATRIRGYRHRTH